MKHLNKLKLAFVFAAMVLTTVMYAQKAPKNKFLEGKKYNVQFYEIKAAGRGKSLPSNVIIKGGKVESDLMYEKMTLGPEVFRVEADSIYTEDETEMHYVSFIVEASDGKNDYRWEAAITNYDIEGTVTMSKGGIEKKKYEFSGSEKPSKKK